MSTVKRLIEILNQRASQDDSYDGNEPGKPIKGTGLKLYSGGKQKTPTGMENAFDVSGLTEQDVLKYAQKFNLPTTSNKEFQQAQLDMLSKTPEGRAVIEGMYKKFGDTRAGGYVDDILGARTFHLMSNTPEPAQVVTPKKEVIIQKIEKKETPKSKYTITWRDDNADNQSGTSSKGFATEKEYELELARLNSTPAGRAFLGSQVTGNGKSEKGRNALFISNPFEKMKQSGKDVEFNKDNYRKQLSQMKDKYNLSDSEIEDLVNKL